MIYPFAPSIWIFLVFTVVLVGGAAVQAGRAIAEDWKPAWQAAAAGFGLTLADRFLVFALFGEPLLGLWPFLVDLAVLVGLALLAWRITHVGRMIRQYPWRYARSGPLSYAERS